MTGVHAAQKVFDERGFLLLPISHLKPNLYRLFRTTYFLRQSYWRQQAFRLRALRPAERGQGGTVGWGALVPAWRWALDREALRLARRLPPSVLDVLTDGLSVRLFGETARFDHLDFASWFNGLLSVDVHISSWLYESYGTLLSSASEPVRAALSSWLADLSVMAELVVLLRDSCQALTANAHIQAEHLHLKSWQARGYKAQWWHLDRGEVSAIATISGYPTTEFLLGADPAPYPKKPPTDDVFVFPEVLEQTINQCPPDDLLLCGARARKESGQSYLWHRAPASPVERIVLVLKTLPRSLAVHPSTA